MSKYLLGLVGVFLFSISLKSQVDIQIQVENYESDTLIFGYYLAEKMLVKDSLLRTSDSGGFQFKGDTSLESGMYMLVSVPEGMFYQILLPEDDQEFEVKIDTASEQELLFTGSDENTLFYDYLQYVDAARKENARLEKVIAETDSVLVSVRDQLRKDQLTINDMVGVKQRQVISEHPNSIVALLLKSNLPFQFPEFTGTPEEIQQKKYLHYKKHYFDNIDLKHPSVLRTPIIDQRISYYLESLTPNQADSIIISVDRILGMMSPGSDTYRYYLSTFLNDYGNSKYIGQDAVYVHLALNYYDKGKAPWVTGENLDEIVGNARRIAPILIGKPAPDFTIQAEDGSPIALSDFDQDYTIIVFWKPDCGHCAKAMPHVIDFNEKWKDKGVQVLTVCTMNGNDYDKCWEDVKAKGMENLINAGDKFRKSRIFSNYYTTSTPKIFILDKDHKIKLKRVPAENLDAVMVELKKIDEQASTSTGQ